MPSGPYAIGSAKWPGLAKLAEECGELIQVLNKLIAMEGDPEHWDGTNLISRIEEEAGDVLAALSFFCKYNPAIQQHRVIARTDIKQALFEKWQKENR